MDGGSTFLNPSGSPRHPCGSHTKVIQSGSPSDVRSQMTAATETRCRGSGPVGGLGLTSEDDLVHRGGPGHAEGPGDLAGPEAVRENVVVDEEVLPAHTTGIGYHKRGLLRQRR